MNLPLPILQIDKKPTIGTISPTSEIAGLDYTALYCGKKKCCKKYKKSEKKRCGRCPGHKN